MTKAQKVTVVVAVIAALGAIIAAIVPLFKSDKTTTETHTPQAQSTTVQVPNVSQSANPTMTQKANPVTTQNASPVVRQIANPVQTVKVVVTGGLTGEQVRQIIESEARKSSDRSLRPNKPKYKKLSVTVFGVFLSSPPHPEQYTYVVSYVNLNPFTLYGATAKVKISDAQVYHEGSGGPLSHFDPKTREVTWHLPPAKPGIIYNQACSTNFK